MTTLDNGSNASNVVWELVTCVFAAHHGQFTEILVLRTCNHIRLLHNRQQTSSHGVNSH